MEIVPVDVQFPFCVSFIPHRGRRVRTNSRTEVSAVGLRSIQKNEARAAFRLHYPAYDRRPLFKLARKEWFARDFSKVAVDVEIISYAGQLWTPMCERTSDPKVQKNDMEEFFEGLAEGEQLCAMETPGVSRDEGAIDVARCIVDDGRDAALSSAADRIYNAFLICDGELYVRRGLPIFVKRSLSKLAWEIDIGDAPPDRAIELDPCVQSSRSWDYDNGQLRSGSMWMPDQKDAVQAAAHPLQDVIPVIHMMVDAPSNDHLVHIQVDALARETARILRGRSTRGWSSMFARPIRREFDSVCKAGGSDNEISSRRLYALQRVHERLASESRGPRLREIKKALLDILFKIQTGLLPDPRISIASSCGLTEAEEAAIEKFL